MIRNHAPKKLYLTAWCFIATFLGIFFVLFVKFLFYSYFCALGILANCNSDELTFANLEHAKTDLKAYINMSRRIRSSKVGFYLKHAFPRTKLDILGTNLFSCRTKISHVVWWI